MKNIFYLIAIILIAGGSWFFFRKDTANNVEPESISSSADNKISDQLSDVGGVKTVLIEASNFQFSIKEIRVKKGDKVKITLSSSQGLHDFVLDEFNVATGRIQAGETASAEFVADKTGSFEYYCSVGNHRQMGMIGKLIVE